MSSIEPLIIDPAYPELLADIARAVHVGLLTAPGVSISYQDAAVIAMAAAEKVRFNLGGVTNYVPKGVSYEASLRDREMYAKFNGTNHARLAKEYNLTEMRVRQICDAMAAEERKRRQIDMFSSGE